MIEINLFSFQDGLNPARVPF